MNDCITQGGKRVQKYLCRNKFKKYRKQCEKDYKNIF